MGSHELLENMIPMSTKERLELIDKISTVKKLLKLSAKSGPDHNIDKIAVGILMDATREIEEQCTELPF